MIRTLLLLALCLVCLPAGAQSDPAADAQTLKQRALELNRDLLILEEELLYPPSSQIALYLSMDVAEYFALDAVKVKIDDTFVTSELYTDNQVDALIRGGVQKLYLGNIKSGAHEISAFFTGEGPQGQPYKRAASLQVEKTTAPLVLELKIVDSTAKLQPVFEIKQWEL
ncbi:AraC family transcriptional regulator [Gilvimarinus xylanilyticus]|uniref:AraC family transcriptional regulator n=1 Tax=Gilvimarinus xylanilyticus TaxID=2944139 RepID=A0A9X2HX26_9GAMM|nr:AraC family transcriptional regulator [Gilvimarinus xylanilyticus]MCP8899725.1 AraC family transcriptional regulator [Gilvimarinus xylanilyticus]